LDTIFDEVRIAQALREELTFDTTKSDYQIISTFFKNRIQPIKGFNELIFIMDSGESESVMLYNELQANFLLIDDKKARNIAENLGVNCIGIIGLMAIAKNKGLIIELKPLFETFIQNKRFYSVELLNAILLKVGEEKISFPTK
jgi:predicted nucleic acid-binding protein